MKKIFKYPLVMENVQEIQMPKGAEILTVQDGREGPCLWAIVDPNAEEQAVIIKIYATGEPINVIIGE